MVVKMAEGYCYVCRDFKVEGDRGTVERELVKHLTEEHRGWITVDAYMPKNKFAKCPVCGGEVNKPAEFCPHCHADLIVQWAKKTAGWYTKD
jgi:uncharacterized OB-fold protein